MSFVFTIVFGADGAAAASAHASPYPEWNALLASRLSATVLRSHDSCSAVPVVAAAVLVAAVVVVAAGLYSATVAAGRPSYPCSAADPYSAAGRLSADFSADAGREPGYNGIHHHWDCGAGRSCNTL